MCRGLVEHDILSLDYLKRHKKIAQSDGMEMRGWLFQSHLLEPEGAGELFRMQVLTIKLIRLRPMDLEHLVVTYKNRQQQMMLAGENLPQLLLLRLMEHGERDNTEKSRGEANVTEKTYSQEGFRLRSKQKGIKELDRNLGRPMNPDEI